MRNMEHLLITRFNLKGEDWATSKNGTVALSDDWLTDRFALFEKYCFPSVKGQTVQAFKWIVLFDEDTPLKFKERIEKIAASYSNFIPLYIQGMSALHASIKLYVRENVKDAFFLTSRVDNDDALSKDYVATVQQKAKPIHHLVIDCRLGLQLCLKKNVVEVRKLYKSSNPFLSIVEQKECMEGIYSKPHAHWKKSKYKTVFLMKPLWLQIVHSRNLLNAVKWKSPLISGVDQNEFPIDYSGLDNVRKPGLLQNSILLLFNLRLFGRKIFAFLCGVSQ
jgi:hypothetical protein